MKRVGQIMAEIGFNKNGPDGAKEAFIKHLIRAAEGVNVMTPSERAEIERYPEKILRLESPKRPAEVEQLSFNFEATGTDDESK